MRRKHGPFGRISKANDLMQAVLVESPGPAEHLRPVEIATPEIGPQDVLIRIRSAGVNFADILCRSATHPGMPEPPLVPGCEGAGEIEAIGSEVTVHAVGDRVAAYSPFGGTYAQWASVPEHYALAIPKEMSFDEAAAFTHVFLTAYHVLLSYGHAQPGESVVLTAAAGGVGTALIQLAQVKQCQVLAGVGSLEKLSVLADLGVEDGFCYRDEGLNNSVMKRTEGRGADLVLDSVGGDIFDEALDSMAPLGRMIVFGVASGVMKDAETSRLLRTSSIFSAFNLSVLFAERDPRIENSWSELMLGFMRSELTPVIRRRFPLSEAAEAHRFMESRRSTGKLLLIPD